MINLGDLSDITNLPSYPAYNSYRQLSSAGGGGSSSGGGGGSSSGGSSSSYHSSHSSSSSSGSGSWIDVVIVLVFMAFMVYFVVKTNKEVIRKAKVENERQKAELEKAAQVDPVWSQGFLSQGAKKVFLSYQRDWGNLDTTKVANYTTPDYCRRATLMMRALNDMNRRNVTDILGSEAGVNVACRLVKDSPDDNEDMFEAWFTAMVNDQLIDTKTNGVVYANKYELSERWYFKRSGNAWLLDGINPLTANASTKQRSLSDFATAHDAFYSLDWGTLLLPQRGQLFKKGAFGVSDINNHVIGELSDSGHMQSDAVIYQIYTYSEKPLLDGAPEYLIGQMIMPKYYDDIIVEKHQGGIFSKVRHGSKFKKVELEWSEFNNRYDVFATKPEQVTSLELLNPQMMERLEAAPFEVNIEVVDNVVYFYAPSAHIDASNYAEMLQILQAAYRELKM